MTQKYFFIICSLSVLIINFFDGISAAKNHEAAVKSSISREVLNYEEDKDTLTVRGGASAVLSDTFIFDITTVRNIENNISTYTWNLSLKDISALIDFTCGNYNLHFGSGLMMGKQSYSSGDPFRKKLSIAKERIISPSNSGNPQYSLYGTVFNLHQISSEIKTYFTPFFSVQRRFISSESYQAGVIDSSLFSLNSRITAGGNNTEPVNVINYGGVSGLQISDLFNFQIYYFETDLKGSSGEDILWDNDKFYAGGGIDLIRNSGFFAEYTDSNISFFIEPAMSSIKNEKTVTDFALAWGIGVQNSIMNFALKGKNCGEQFHSEYSSGSRTPERIWESRIAIHPLEFLETGIVLYSEKDLTPAYSKDYTEGSIQEEIFAGITFDALKINFNIKRKEKYSDDRSSGTDHGAINAGINLSDRLYLKLRSSMQKNSGNTSYLTGGEIKFLFLDRFSIASGYTRIIIHGDIPFYAALSPASENSTASSFRESAHAGGINLKYKKDKDLFYIRFSILRTESETSGEIESALTLFI